jgi:anaerobic selenocysteine-containing dehydrogenase
MMVEYEDDGATGDGGAIPNAPRIKRVIGDRDHPLSKGYLCVKGKASIDVTQSDKRVVYPQRRVGARGAGRWERVSWDDALGDIATRLNDIIETHGARAIAVQALPPKEYYAYDLFCDAIGTPTFFKHDSHNCFTPQLMSDILSFGNLLTYPGFVSVQDSDVILLWGVNLSETNGSKAARVRDAQRWHGARTIVVDPRPTRSTKEADLWLRIRPGTDAALALGMINVMIEEELYDKAFVAEWTEGFDQLVERAAAYPPERVAEITWIAADDIREAARMFGGADKAAMYTFIGATMGGNSISTLRLMGFLPALTGNIDIDGCNRFLLPTTVRMPGYYGTQKDDDPRDLANQISADKFPLFAGPDAITTPYPHPRHVIDAMLTGEPYPVRALWTDCNPMVGIEDSYLVRDALMSLDLLVVSELFESPTAHLADYILPLTTHLESNAIAEYAGINLVSARVRAMEPRGEAREEAVPVLEVIQRMGYGDKIKVSSYEELLDYRLEPLGMGFEEFKKVGSVIGADEQLKYRKGKMRRDGEPGFATPSGKVEFASRRLAEHGYDPLPDFVEPPFSPVSRPDLAEEYPLILGSGTRSVEFYSTLGVEVPRLLKRRPFPTLEMSPETAADHDLEEGDWVMINSPSSPHGIRRRVALLAGMHPGMVNAEGLWHMPGEDPTMSALDVGANVLTPLSDDFDPIMGGSVARCVLCRIRKIEPEEMAAAAE